MTRRAAAAALLFALACLFLGFTAGRAAGPASRPTPDFAPVRTPAAVSSQPTPSVSMPGLILEPDLSTPIPRSAVEQPEGELRIVTARPVVVLAPTSGVHGPASWYDDPRKAGLYAAAGPALRVGDWRGRTVTVCGAVCFAVVLSDWCQCPGGRVIDLSSNAFRRLAPLGIGVTEVVVTW